MLEITQAIPFYMGGFAALFTIVLVEISEEHFNLATVKITHNYNLKNLSYNTDSLLPSPPPPPPPPKSNSVEPNFEHPNL